MHELFNIHRPFHLLPGRLHDGPLSCGSHIFWIQAFKSIGQQTLASFSLGGSSGRLNASQTSFLRRNTCSLLRLGGDTLRLVRAHDLTYSNESCRPQQDRMKYLRWINRLRLLVGRMVTASWRGPKQIAKPNSAVFDSSFSTCSCRHLHGRLQGTGVVATCTPPHADRIPMTSQVR